MYVGAPRAGIWKTTDSGAAWVAAGDNLPTLAVAALAVDRGTPSRVYVLLVGVNIYRSDDHAVTWNFVHGDLGAPSGAGVLLIDPNMPSRLYMTAASNGLFRSDDSGASWNVTKTGTVTDLAIDPSNRNWTVLIDYNLDAGKTNGIIIRVASTK